MSIRIQFVAGLLLCGILLHVVYAQEEPANLYAVLIGISQFEAGEKWALNFADADATSFQRLITSPRGRGFSQVQLLTNQNAKLQAIKQRVGGLFSRVNPRDTVYIFVATHGIVQKKRDKERAFLLAYDSDPEDLSANALDLRELSAMIRDLDARIFLFGDFCRGGKLGQSLALFEDDISKKTGIMGLLASDSGEDSFEGDQWHHGVFTYYLLKGLMGEADTNHDNVVNANEIIRYVTNQVEDQTGDKQHPRLFGTFEGMRTTPLSLIDKPGPQDLTRTLMASPVLQFASTQVALPESAQTQAAFRDALQQGRLIEPAGNSAWDLYQRYNRLTIPQAEKESLKDDLVIALAAEGEKVMWAYRRGDAIVPIDAAKYEQGAQLFTRASEIAPRDAALRLKAKFLSGRALVERRRYNEGIASLREASMLDPDAAYPYNALGIAYLDQQRWNDAVTNFKAASERAEKWIYPHYNLARVHTAQKHYRDAEDELKKATRIGADLGLKYSYLYYNLGILYLFQGRTVDAEEQFRHAIGMKPDDALSYHNLGLVYERKRDAGQAESAFQKAASIDKNLIEPRLKLAEIYGSQHRTEQEQQMIKEAETADTSVGSSLELLGRFLFDRKKFDEAEQVYVRMLTRSDDAAGGLSGLGDVHAAQNRWKDAADDYRQAIARTTDPKIQRDLQKKLQAAEKKK
jgi:tetratricopeptide (TPR) repeat protein